jgi:adenine-specific DNA-methyltransferase
MRYIGSKAGVIDFLVKNIQLCANPKENKTFADLFAGTTVVSRCFKKLGYKIISNDYMAFSFVLQNAYIKINSEPNFSNLKTLGLKNYVDVIKKLNSLKPIKGFFFNNYCNKGTKNKEFQRNYFLSENACKIDAIMLKIKNWKKMNLITKNEESALRTSLLEAIIKVSNISGTFGAFLKKDDPRKFKPLLLEPIKFIESDEMHKCNNKDIFEIIDVVSGDILYLDPPYNQRQYPPYYHMLETVSLDDNPDIYGKTGRRHYEDKLSPFCMKSEVFDAMYNLIERANFEHIFLSYNTEGLLSLRKITSILTDFGEVKMFFQSQRRFKSNSNGESPKSLKEVLFYVRKE